MLMFLTTVFPFCHYVPSQESFFDLCYQEIFPGSTIIFDISLVYILTALIAVLLNNVIIETFSLNTR